MRRTTRPRPIGPPAEAGTREGRANLIYRVLKQVFAVNFQAFPADRSLRNAHAIAPGHLFDFLADLQRDYGFAISADDGKNIDSVKDILGLLEQRHPIVEIAPLLDQLSRGDDSVSNQTLLRAYLAFACTCQTNCDEAAQALMAMAERVCTLRPALLPLVLRRALEPIYCLGLEDAGNLLEWVRLYTTSRATYFQGSVPPGLAWMERLAEQSPDVVASVFDHLRTWGEARYPELEEVSRSVE